MKRTGKDKALTTDQAGLGTDVGNGVVEEGSDGGTKGRQKSESGRERERLATKSFRTGNKLRSYGLGVRAVPKLHRAISLAPVSSSIWTIFGHHVLAILSCR